MKRLRLKDKVFLGAIAVLIVLGFLRDPLSPAMFIPVIVVGVVFLLYKFPPTRFGAKKHPKVKPSKRTAAKMAAKSSKARKSSNPSPKRKHYPFQVIDGQKGKNDPPDDLPKYH
ncbi:hypothetical protein [Paenibacillus dakarensis]|uniref:hypothetical protein n=1 Tax=Paenibacillus dakarensis TaxID=1527293 RepID=UPI0006D59248|nr:hypothetical protein [Paenibacillus dakarensis]